MQKRFLLAAIAGFSCLTVHANPDRPVVATIAAKHAAAPGRITPARQDNTKPQIDADHQAMRNVLGKSAEGKSDAEVERLYRQHMIDEQERANSWHTTNQSIGN